MWALDECKKYGSLHTYLELLYDIKKNVIIGLKMR